jgi:hypothetical protein
MQEVVASAKGMQNDKVDVVTPPAPPAMHFTRVECIIHGDAIISHNEHARSLEGDCNHVHAVLTKAQGRWLNGKSWNARSVLEQNTQRMSTVGVEKEHADWHTMFQSKIHADCNKTTASTRAWQHVKQQEMQWVQRKA